MNRIGPDAPDNSMVICPVCTSQFVAISVDDQRERSALQARYEALEAALRRIVEGDEGQWHPDPIGPLHGAGMRRAWKYCADIARAARIRGQPK